MKSILWALCCVVLLVRLSPAGAVSSNVVPSDCRARDADSTCATAVAGATAPPTHVMPDGVLYDGPLAGVPATGYAYWGWDFIADQSGDRSPVRQDEFVNRSKSVVAITLSFDVPQRATCDHDCLPGVEFEIGPGWYKVDPPYVRTGGRVSLTASIQPGQGYGWVIGLWESTNPRLTVTVPKHSTATMADVGLGADMSVANEIAQVVGLCDCGDGTSAPCSDGTRFSNGLLGEWIQRGEGSGYLRAGGLFECVVQH